MEQQQQGTRGILGRPNSDHQGAVADPDQVAHRLKSGRRSQQSSLFYFQSTGIDEDQADVDRRVNVIGCAVANRRGSVDFVNAYRLDSSQSWVLKQLDPRQ